jgi:hypothetical protein
MATVSISLVREHTEKLRPPRALFVPFPFGAPFGRALDPEQQHRVLRAALELLQAPTGPVLRELDDDLDAPASPVQASAVEPAAPALDVATEVTTMRRYHEQWLAREAKTTVGVSGIPPRRFRGIVRFLEAFAAGRDADHPQRPPDVPVEVFLRWCADDLKALYLEARLAMAPDDRGEEVARWFWGETALAVLLREVGERLTATGEPALERLAYGIVR